MQTELIKRIVSRFKQTRVLVVGDVILDEFIWGSVDRISPEAPVPVVMAKERSFMPGGACNVASNIRSLGAKVSIAGIVGKDQHSQILLKELKRRRINTKGLFIDSKRPTTHKVRIIAQHQQVVRLDWENAEAIKRPLITKITNFIKEQLDNFDAIIIEDYGKGVVTADLLTLLAKLVQGSNKIITVDPKEEHFSLYKNIKLTAITPNRKETENAIRNIKVKDKNPSFDIDKDRLVSDHDIDLAGRELLKYLGSDAVLLTLGESGMRLFEKNKKPAHIDTVAQEVFDVSGAGDTVIATFSLALAAGANMLSAAHIANFAASIVVGKIGVATASQGELLDIIKMEK